MKVKIQRIKRVDVGQSSLYYGDCISAMKRLPDKSINLVATDLPYGTTQCKWDCLINLDSLWEQWKRIIVDGGVILSTAAQPFTSVLISSNFEWFKYSWVWNKINRPTGFLNSKKQPLRITEDIVVFYKTQCIYNPQMGEGKPYTALSGANTEIYGEHERQTTINLGSRFPLNLLNIKADRRGVEGRIHPTQKPVELFEYLIKTYSNTGDTVLDCCMGSGTTGVAAVKLGRKFIGIDDDLKSFEISTERLERENEC